MPTAEDFDENVPDNRPKMGFQRKWNHPCTKVGDLLPMFFLKQEHDKHPGNPCLFLASVTGGKYNSVWVRIWVKKTGCLYPVSPHGISRCRLEGNTKTNGK